jgi:hypothetical protein
MDLQDKLQIYDLLLTNYAVGERVPLSALGNFLRMHDITPDRYGFDKLMPLFEAMPEICTLTSTETRPGVPLVWHAALLPRPRVEDGVLIAAPAAPATEAPVPSKSSPAGLPENMDQENVFFPASLQFVLSEYITGQRDLPLSPEHLKQVKADYCEALAAQQVVFDSEHGVYTFPLSLADANGSPLIASICRSSHGGSAWFVKYVGHGAVSGSRRSGKPGDALRSFAYLGQISAFLHELAEHAQEEPWSFHNRPDDYAILHQYISYTFYRLQQENKICIAEDGSFAAFNTGLQSRRLGEDIFAYFTPNSPDQESPWRFSCFCSTDSRDPNERRCYKIMYNAFKEPEPASYFSKISDLLFDPACEVRLSSDHIFKDNCDRLPMDFLQRECSWNPDASALLQEIASCSDPVRRETLFDRLGTIITDDPDLFSAMDERLQGALQRTIKRVRRNYKLAVPCFFPTRNVMSMMLPLSFSSTGAPSLVLVCERALSGDYLGQTILTLPMAYMDARLLCRPGSEWLDTDRILDSETPLPAES